MEKEDIIKIAEDWKNKVNSRERGNRTDVKLFLNYYNEIKPLLNSINYQLPFYDNVAESLR
jgi:hypothetical protein